jgi:hypothetical protein
MPVEVTSAAYFRVGKDELSVLLRNKHGQEDAATAAEKNRRGCDRSIGSQSDLAVPPLDPPAHIVAVGHDGQSVYDVVARAM